MKADAVVEAPIEAASAGAVKTIDPATRLSGGAPGKFFGSGFRSATVTCFVASTNLRNSALVTPALRAFSRA
ncbi:MAG: hypothetical protein AABY08_03880, partial [Candidatus Thermoplasmatota archaeon]